VTEAAPLCRCGKYPIKVERGWDVCYLCGLRSIGFSWRGGGGVTKEAFHERTIGEWIEHNVDLTDPNVEKMPTGTWT
jgi:hypothetical protein